MDESPFPLFRARKRGMTDIPSLEKADRAFLVGDRRERSEDGEEGGRMRRLLMSDIKLTRTDIAACPFPSRRWRREIDRFLIIAARSFSLDPPWRRGREKGKEGGREKENGNVDKLRAPCNASEMWLALRKTRAIDEIMSEKDGRFVVIIGSRLHLLIICWLRSSSSRKYLNYGVFTQARYWFPKRKERERERDMMIDIY